MESWLDRLYPEITLGWKIATPFIVLFLVFLMAAWHDVLSFIATVAVLLFKAIIAMGRRAARALPLLEKELISKPRHL